MTSADCITSIGNKGKSKTRSAWSIAGDQSLYCIRTPLYRARNGLNPFQIKLDFGNYPITTESGVHSSLLQVSVPSQAVLTFGMGSFSYYFGSANFHFSFRQDLLQEKPIGSVPSYPAHVSTITPTYNSSIDRIEITFNFVQQSPGGTFYTMTQWRSTPTLLPGESITSGIKINGLSVPSVSFSPDETTLYIDTSYLPAGSHTLALSPSRSLQGYIDSGLPQGYPQNAYSYFTDNIAYDFLK